MGGTESIKKNVKNMAITKALGGERLGSGNKMNVTLHGFNRSSHNIGQLFKTDQAIGTLVPYCYVS